MFVSTHILATHAYIRRSEKAIMSLILNLIQSNYLSEFLKLCYK